MRVRRQIVFARVGNKQLGHGYAAGASLGDIACGVRAFRYEGSAQVVAVSRGQIPPEYRGALAHVAERVASVGPVLMLPTGARSEPRYGRR